MGQDAEGLLAGFLAGSIWCIWIFFVASSLLTLFGPSVLLFFLASLIFSWIVIMRLNVLKDKKAMKDIRDSIHDKLDTTTVPSGIMRSTMSRSFRDGSFQRPLKAPRELKTRKRL